MEKHEEVWGELLKIQKRLEELHEKYKTSFEFVFLTTVYDEKKRMYDGMNISYVLNDNNYRVYVNNLEANRKKAFESSRFEFYLKLGNVRVVCVDNSIGFDDHRIYEENDCDWLEYNESYFITNYNELHDGYAFQLKKLDGTLMRCPPQFSGYHSCRFMIDDDKYKLN